MNCYKGRITALVWMLMLGPWVLSTKPFLNICFIVIFGVFCRTNVCNSEYGPYSCGQACGPIRGNHLGIYILWSGQKRR